MGDWLMKEVRVPAHCRKENVILQWPQVCLFHEAVSEKVKEKILPLTASLVPLDPPSCSSEF